MRQQLRDLLDQSYGLSCAARIAVNYAKGARYRLGWIDTKSGTIHHGLDASESVAYIRRVFDDYKRYAQVSRFAGRVAELGPGDNCGVALLMLNDGCESADLLDRFYSERDREQQRRIYRQLFDAFPTLAQRCANIDPASEDGVPGIRWHYGPSAAAEVFFRDHQGFDVILSRAVLEHLYDPIRAIHDMARALRPGGMMLHAVDLRDHGMFSRRFHELKYLEIPAAVYPHMTRSSGGPNRVLTPAYRQALREERLDFRILVTSLASVGMLEEYAPWEDLPAAVRERAVHFVRDNRARIAAPLHALSDQDLAITGIFIVARRTAA